MFVSLITAYGVRFWHTSFVRVCLFHY